MKGVKSIAGVLFYLSRICVLGYAILAVFSSISLLTGWFLKFKGDYFNIQIPFTEKTFLIGERNLPYIIFDFLMVFVLYSIFFWLLSNVFKTFIQPKLFNKKSINRLRYFYLSNLFIPSLATLLACLFSNIDSTVIMLIILHFVLGIFAYFMAAIFKQGVNLQNEQDLFI